MRDGIQKLGNFFSLPATMLDTEEPAGGAGPDLSEELLVLAVLLELEPGRGGLS